MATYKKMYLTAYKYSLESKIQWIATAKLELCASSDEISALGNDLDPENPAVKQLQDRMRRLDTLEKQLDTQMQDYQTRLKMVEAELQSCDGAIDSAINTSFKY